MNDETQKDEAGSTRSKKSFLGVGLAAVLVCAAFFSGVQFGSGASGDNLNQEAGLFSIFSRPVTVDENVDLAEFWQVWHLLDSKFVAGGEPVTEEEKIQGAIAGLVKSYDDPYTVFFPPVDASDFNESITGEFSGVGMEVGIRDSLITIIAPLPDTPAETAGLLPGDVIVRIDDQSTENMDIDTAVDLIRGEKGTVVELTVFREGENEFLPFSVTRDIIEIPTIDTEVIDDVFVISLYNFNALSELLTQKALREFVQSGKKKMILDLRGNPGGFLQSAIGISSFFLPTGKVIVREDYGGDVEETVHRSQGKTLEGFAPEEVVILIDQGSASASEIVAGALSEQGVATLIGQTSFGKGSVQELIDLPDGSSVKITIARWLTPDGTSISEGGLTPEVAIERTPQDRLEDKDPQLDAAIAWLGGKRDFPTATSTDEQLLGE